MLTVTKDTRRPSKHQYTIMMSPHTHTHTQYIIIQDMRSKVAQWWFTCLLYIMASLSAAAQ